MSLKIGDSVLVTTDNWFFAPDGQQYKAVWGEVRGIFSDEQMLGIKTNTRSTNWYAQIGNVFIAGCQIHYAVKSPTCNFISTELDEFKDGVVLKGEARTRIYNAN